MGPLGHSVAALSALAAAPLAGAALLLRPAWRAGWRERLGRTSCAGRASLWIHAASLGETRAALPLAKGFAEHGETIYLTHTRADALAVPFDLGAAALGRGLAPLDHPWCSARALAAVAPRAVILVETELWPNGIRAAVDRGIAVGVVSGSISDRSFERYCRFERFIRPTFERLGFVGAQTERDAERFLHLGAAAAGVAVTGDLKSDASVAVGAAPACVTAGVAGRPLFVAGSTHEGEEAIVLDAYAQLRAQRPEAVCLIAPRRIERAREIEALAAERGLRSRRRSAGDATPLASGEILLLDTLGELASCYSIADVAFVGGSLVPVGGHNLYEPAQAGALVLHGPHATLRTPEARRLGELGLARSVDGAAEFGEQLCEALGSTGEPGQPRSWVAATRSGHGAPALGNSEVAERARAFVAQQLEGLR